MLIYIAHHRIEPQVCKAKFLKGEESVVQPTNKA